jgi:hypothetical protein
MSYARWVGLFDARLSMGTMRHETRRVAHPGGTRWGKSEAAMGSSCSFSRVGSCAGLGLKLGSAAGKLRSG